MSIESRHLCPRTPVLKLSPGLGTDDLSGILSGRGNMHKVALNHHT